MLICGLCSEYSGLTWQTNTDNKPKKQNETIYVKQIRMMKMLYRERSSYQKGGVGGFEFEHLPPFVSLRYTRPRVWGLAAWAFFSKPSYVMEATSNVMSWNNEMS